MTDEAPSKFLKGTNVQWAWDSTSLSALKVCPRYYKYVMIDGWETKEESVHLRFGIEYHRALQDYDLSRAANIVHDDAVHDVIRELLIRTSNFESDHKTKTRESLIRTVIWYIEQFKDDTAETLIKSDGTPAVEESFKFPLDWKAQLDEENIGYWLCGHLDKIVRFNDELFVKDYKTVYTFWGKSWEPDNQMTLYTLASRIVLGTAVRGVIIDMAQVKQDVTEFKRDFTFRTEDQLQEWLADLRYWLTLAEQYAVNNYWPMNDLSCDKYGGCRFREVCSKSPAVRDRFLEGSFVKQPPEERWNPLKPR